MTFELAPLPQQCDVAIIGSGPSGLALATQLRRLGIKDVHVIERDSEAGGVPRHCGHPPFGLFEFKRLLKGPEYARRLVAQAHEHGCLIHTNTTVTDLGAAGQLTVATNDGVTQLKAKRVVLCTGVRESSRAQRFISGQRPSGVVATGALQSMVYEQHLRPFVQPVILGTELVSFSAILTCRHAGIKPIAMLEERDRVTARLFTHAFARVTRLPIRFGVRNITIHGERHVEAIEYKDTTGKTQTIETDGVIVSGQFRPESALLRMSHIDVDQASGGPIVDQFGRCSDPAYFCAGNALRPVETSQWCWREGNELAGRIAVELTSDMPIPTRWVPVRCKHAALAYCMPQQMTITDQETANQIVSTQVPMDAIQIRITRPVKGKLVVTSNNRTLWTKAIHSRPERRILIPITSVVQSMIDGPIDISIIE